MTEFDKELREDIRDIRDNLRFVRSFMEEMKANKTECGCGGGAGHSGSIIPKGEGNSPNVMIKE